MSVYVYVCLRARVCTMRMCRLIIRVIVCLCVCDCVCVVWGRLNVMMNGGLGWSGWRRGREAIQHEDDEDDCSSYRLQHLVSIHNRHRVDQTNGSADEWERTGCRRCSWCCCCRRILLFSSEAEKGKGRQKRGQEEERRAYNTDSPLFDPSKIIYKDYSHHSPRSHS